jgi:hypothetical protein
MSTVEHHASRGAGAPFHRAQGSDGIGLFVNFYVGASDRSVAAHRSFSAAG